ncbi:hypothetical protein OG462_09290 [Streptomyces sp. NBC_01077]|uniref:phage tail protein n=1 Tax=Streptomyces sp. NBC_01077 TaxID=2903746 RepID=UPI00386A7D75|nr:hypothetical protein OG462_09290 [Streptomyces sp. NBC_01077]
MPPASPYTPAAPLSAQVNCVLMQDAVNTSSIMISLDQNPPQSVAPWVGTFCNPFNNGLAEAFVITDTPSGGGEGSGTYTLNHLAQDPAAAHGWTLTPVQGAPAGTPTAVVACIADGQPNFFCLLPDSSTETSTIWQGRLNSDGTVDSTTYTFAFPAPTLKLAYYNPAVQGPSTTPIATTGNDPLPIVYALSDDVVEDYEFVCMATLTYDGSGWRQSPMLGGMGIKWSSQNPTITDWTLFPVAGHFGNWVLVFTEARDPAEQALFAFSCVDGDTLSGPGVYSPGSPAPVTVPQSLAGICWEGSEYGFRPLYIDTNGVPFLYDPEYGSIVLPVNTSGTITSAQSVTDSLGMTSVYFTDSDGTLSFLKQTGYFNNSDNPDEYTIQWAPSMAISCTATTTGNVDEGADAVFASSFPNDPPTLFTANALGELRLHQLMPGGWVNHTPALAQVNTYEVTTYRTQFTLTDANGMPVTNRSLTVGASTTVGAVINGTVQIIGPDATQAATVTTTALGVVTVALLATDFAPPTLTFTDLPPQSEGDAGQGFGAVQAAPAGPVQAYLAGSTAGIPHGGTSATGTLDYKTDGNTTFTPDALSGAQLPHNGGPVFPGVQGDSPVMTADQAHTAVQNLMAKGTGTGQNLAGFIINRDVVTGRPSYQEFADHDAFLGELAHHNNVIGEGLWGDIEGVWDSVWQGIKSAAMAVYHVGADLINGIVQIAVKIGDAIVNIGSIVIKGIEDAVNAVMAVFSAIAAYIKDVIDFLKALFDAPAIFASAQAISTGLRDALSTAQAAVGHAITNIGPDSTYFHDLLDTVNNAIESAFGNIGPDLALATSPGWQQYADPSTTAGNTQQVQKTANGGSAVSPSDITTSPHAHMVTHQMFAALPSPTKSAGGGAGTRARPGPDGAHLTAGSAPRSMREILEECKRRMDEAGPADTPADDDPLAGLWKALTEESTWGYFKDFGDDLETLARWIMSQIQFDDPSTYPNLNIKQLLEQLTEDLVDGLLTFLDVIVVALLEAIQVCLDEFENLLDSEVEGPLAIPLLLAWNFFNVLAGNKIVASITVEQAITLMVAVPGHVLGTIVTGKSASIAWPPPFDSQARPREGGPELSALLELYYFFGFIADMVEGGCLGWVDTCKAAGWSGSLKEFVSVATGIGALANILSFALTSPLSGLGEWPVIGWGVGTGLATLGMGVWQLFEWFEVKNYADGWGTNSDVLDFVLSVFNMIFGVAALAIGVVSVAEEEGGWPADRVLALVAAIVGPWANMVSPLGSNLVRKYLPNDFTPFIPPVCDVISYWGGGLLALFSNLGLWSDDDRVGVPEH